MLDWQRETMCKKLESLKTTETENRKYYNFEMTLFVRVKRGVRKKI